MSSPASDYQEVASATGRIRVSGKTSLSRLSIAEAVEALGVEVDVLRRRIQEGSMPHEHDRHGHVYVFVGAYSKLPHADHSRRRKLQDKAIVRDLEAQAAILRQTPGPLEELNAPPRTPGTPEGPLYRSKPHRIRPGDT